MAGSIPNSPQGQLFQAQLVADPLAKPEDGAKIAFSAMLMKGFPSNATNFIDDPRTFKGTLLSLHVIGDGIHAVDGTAVMVAPGIAISARHVVEAYLACMNQKGLECVCSTLTDDGLQIWAVEKINTSSDFDFAILGLVLRTPMPKTEPFRYASITTRMPRIGESLSIVGLRAIETETGRRGDNRFSTLVTSSLLSSGYVTGQYPTGRDRIMLPWPVLEVSCPTWGGMSGGPVFDDSGYLVGLLCSSLLGEDGQGTSYISMIYPVLCLEFSGGWPANLIPQPTTLLDLGSFCPIEGREALTYSVDPATNLRRIDYRSWDWQ